MPSEFYLRGKQQQNNNQPQTGSNPPAQPSVSQSTTTSNTSGLSDFYRQGKQQLQQAAQPAQPTPQKSWWESITQGASDLGTSLKGAGELAVQAGRTFAGNVATWLGEEVGTTNIGGGGTKPQKTALNIKIENLNTEIQTGKKIDRNAAELVGQGLYNVELPVLGSARGIVEGIGSVLPKGTPPEEQLKIRKDALQEALKNYEENAKFTNNYDLVNQTKQQLKGLDSEIAFWEEESKRQKSGQVSQITENLYADRPNLTEEEKIAKIKEVQALQEELKKLEEADRKGETLEGQLKNYGISTYTDAQKQRKEINEKYGNTEFFTPKGILYGTVEQSIDIVEGLGTHLAAAYFAKKGKVKTAAALEGVSLVSNYAQEFGNVYNQAKLEGATDKQATQAARIYAPISVAISKIGIGDKLGNLKISKFNAENIENELQRKLVSGTIRRTKAGIGEALEENTQDLVSTALSQIYKENPQWFEGATETTVISFLLGAILSGKQDFDKKDGITIADEKKANQNIDKALAKKPEQRTDFQKALVEEVKDRTAQKELNRSKLTGEPIRDVIIDGENVSDRVRQAFAPATTPTEGFVTPPPTQPMVTPEQPATTPQVTPTTTPETKPTVTPTPTETPAKKTIKQVKTETKPKVAKLKDAEETLKQDVTLYRGGKGTGFSTLVRGKYFGDNEQLAKQFGDISETSTLPKGTKVFNLDLIKENPNQTIVPKEMLVDTKALTKFLLDKGYTVTKNTTSRGGVEYVMLGDKDIDVQNIAKRFKNQTEFLNYLATDKGQKELKDKGIKLGTGEATAAWNLSQGLDYKGKKIEKEAPKKKIGEKKVEKKEVKKPEVDVEKAFEIEQDIKKNVSQIIKDFNDGKITLDERNQLANEQFKKSLVGYDENINLSSIENQTNDTKVRIENKLKDLDVEVNKNTLALQHIFDWVIHGVVTIDEQILKPFKGVGVNKLNFDKDGNTVLWRVGELDNKRPYSFSANKKFDSQKPYLVNKKDILVYLGSKDLRNKSNTILKDYKDVKENYDDVFTHWANFEDEVLARPENIKPISENKVKSKITNETALRQSLSEQLDKQSSDIIQYREDKLKLDDEQVEDIRSYVPQGIKSWVNKKVIFYKNKSELNKDTDNTNLNLKIGDFIPLIPSPDKVGFLKDNPNAQGIGVFSQANINFNAPNEITFKYILGDKLINDLIYYNNGDKEYVNNKNKLLKIIDLLDKDSRQSYEDALDRIKNNTSIFNENQTLVNFASLYIHNLPFTKENYDFVISSLIPDKLQEGFTEEDYRKIAEKRFKELKTLPAVFTSKDGQNGVLVLDPSFFRSEEYFREVFDFVRKQKKLVLTHTIDADKLLATFMDFDGVAPAISMGVSQDKPRANFGNSIVLLNPKLLDKFPTWVGDNYSNLFPSWVYPFFQPKVETLLKYEKKLEPIEKLIADPLSQAIQQTVSFTNGTNKDGASLTKEQVEKYKNTRNYARNFYMDGVYLMDGWAYHTGELDDFKYIKTHIKRREKNKERVEITNTNDVNKLFEGIYGKLMFLQDKGVDIENEPLVKIEEEMFVTDTNPTKRVDSYYIPLKEGVLLTKEYELSAELDNKIKENGWGDEFEDFKLNAAQEILGQPKYYAYKTLNAKDYTAENINQEIAGKGVLSSHRLFDIAIKDGYFRLSNFRTTASPSIFSSRFAPTLKSLKEVKKNSKYITTPYSKENFGSEFSKLKIHDLFKKLEDIKIDVDESHLLTNKKTRDIAKPYIKDLKKRNRYTLFGEGGVTPLDFINIRIFDAVQKYLKNPKKDLNSATSIINDLIDNPSWKEKNQKEINKIAKELVSAIKEMSNYPKSYYETKATDVIDLKKDVVGVIIPTEKYSASVKRLKTYLTKYNIPFIEKDKNWREVPTAGGNVYVDVDKELTEKLYKDYYFRLGDDLAPIIGYKISPKQEKELTDWVKKHFGDKISVKLVAQIMANRKALASYRKTLIEISQNKATSDKETWRSLYHEAFHAYRQAFMTKEETLDLFTNVAKVTGLTDIRLIEEYLAENTDFKNGKFGFSGGFVKYAETRTGVIGKIRLLLDKLFVRVADYFNLDASAIKTYSEILTPAKEKEKKISKLGEKKAAQAPPEKKKLGAKKMPKVEAPAETIGGGKVKKSRFMERLNEQLLGTNPEAFGFNEADGSYNVANLDRESEKAINFIEADPMRALNIALGNESAPAGYLENTIEVAVALRLKQLGNLDLYKQVLVRNSLKNTRRGQEIASLRGQFNDNSAENYIKRALDARLNRLGDKFAGGLGQRATMLGLKKSNKKEVFERIQKEKVELKKVIKDAKKIKSAQDIIDSLRC